MHRSARHRIELHSASAALCTNRHEFQFWITTLLRFSRQLTGKRLAPERVRFAHVRGRRAAEISNHLSCDVEYGATSDSMLFAGRARDLPIVNADPHLNRLLIGFCEQAIRGQRRRAPAFASMVENAIATLLPYLKEPELSISEIRMAPRISRRGRFFTRIQALDGASTARGARAFRRFITADAQVTGEQVHVTVPSESGLP